MKKKFIVKRSLITLPIICAASLLAPGARAGIFHRSSEHGTITAVDPTHNQLTVKDARKGSSEVFTWNAGTKFYERDGGVLSRAKPATASNLKSGEKASVRYAREGDQLVAKKVVIAP